APRSLEGGEGRRGRRSLEGHRLQRHPEGLEGQAGRQDREDLRGRRDRTPSSRLVLPLVSPRKRSRRALKWSTLRYASFHTSRFEVEISDLPVDAVNAN